MSRSMSMSTRLLLLVMVIGTMLSICWPLAGMGAPTQPLLSQHSRPAVRLPARIVAIVSGGKLFHDAKCSVMHGAPRLVSAEEAARLGYTPCTRCMRQALAKN